ncbi:hypothetical protein Emed_005108 [Eimeria media]
MTPKGPPYGEGAPPSGAAVWYEGPPPLALSRLSPRPLGPPASLLHTPRCGPSSLDSGWVALLLEQLHKSPAAAKRGPLPEGLKTPRSSSSSSSNSSSSSSSSSSRDFLLRVLADEIMPQFLADPSVQQMASVLLQQQSPADFQQVGRGAPLSFWGAPYTSTNMYLSSKAAAHNEGAPAGIHDQLLWALESEVAKWERLMGPPLHQGGPPSLSSSGGPLSARGWSASPSPPPGGPRGPPDDEGPGGPPLGSAAGTPAGTPRESRASPRSRRVVGALGAPSRLQEGAPPSEAREAFVTPVAAADAPPSLLQGPPDAADLGPPAQTGNDSLRGAPQQAWERGPPDGGGPPTSRRDSPRMPADTGAPTMQVEGPPPSGRPEDATSLLAAVRAARERVVGPLLGLGPFLAGPLFRRIDADNSGVVTPEKLKKACTVEGIEGEEAVSTLPVIKRGSLINFMGAISNRNKNYIYPEELRPWVLGRP